MKKLFCLSSIFLFSCLTVFAQRKNTYLIKNNGEYVLKADSADYFRTVEEPAKGSSLYLIKEFYINGNRKSVGYSLKIDPPSYEGQNISYFENGKKKQIANYVNGKLSDTVYNYYPNGNIYCVIAYKQGPVGPSIYFKTVKDSTGKDLVTDGNGEATFFSKDFKYVTEKGTIKNGIYDGTWTGENREHNITYKENYVNGTLIAGESKDQDGQTYQYTKPVIPPAFRGGMGKFYQLVAKNVRYPRDAVSRKAQGIVMIRFTVLKDGTLSGLHPINYADMDLAGEAMRIISTSPVWQPGIYRGKLVKTTFDLPISFMLSN